MIPLRSSERVHSRTPVVTSLIVINLAMFLYQLSLGPYLSAFLMKWGIVPDLINRNLWSLVTSMFLHGGWVHLGSNMVFLWAFGRNIEDRIGSKQFAVFYLLCGLASGIIHVITNPYSRVPTIGASGAIAGVMGAYLIKFSKTEIDTLFWMIFLWRMPIPAAYFLIYWFVLQFLSGLNSIGEADYTGGGIAWFAHIGGFLAGMALIGMFKDARPAYRAWYEED